MWHAGDLINLALKRYTFKKADHPVNEPVSPTTEDEGKLAIVKCKAIDTEFRVSIQVKWSRLGYWTSCVFPGYLATTL